MISNNSIAFWGTSPPPIGGMSVHIKRLSAFLKKNGWNITQYNFKNKKRNESYIINIKNIGFWYLKLWFAKSPKTHYVITSTTYVRFLASLLTLRGKKIVMRVGGRSLENSLNGNILERTLAIISLKLCTGFIGVNTDICKLAEKHTSKVKINNISGFIPPNQETSTPIEITNFFSEKDYLKLVITGQVVEENEEDIYGLHHAINSLLLLKKEGCKFKCCIVSYTISGDNISQVQRFRKKINTLGLKENVILYHNTDELWPILKVSDIFLRTSITDGDANSIREALFFKKIVIASDCVQRPKDCITYKTLDCHDLIHKIKNHTELTQMSKEDPLSNQDRILTLINNL